MPNPFHKVNAKFDLVLRPISHGNPAMPFIQIEWKRFYWNFIFCSENIVLLQKNCKIYETLNNKNYDTIYKNTFWTEMSKIDIYYLSKYGYFNNCLRFNTKTNVHWVWYFSRRPFEDVNWRIDLNRNQTF